MLPANYDPPRVYGIPDRTIGALIEQIAKKGDNITVIFDCCHSGSATRAANRDLTPRGVELADNVPPTLDDSIWKARGAQVATEFDKHRLRSHILLSACNQEELAYEAEGRGQFTRALLTTLNDSRPDQLTYANVLEYIGPLNGQHPQCEGYHRERLFFNVKAPDSSPPGYSVRKSGDGYVIDAGSAQGISKGAAFIIYPDIQDTTVPLAAMVVDDTAVMGAFETTITPRDGMPVEIPEGSIALLTRAGDTEELTFPFLLLYGTNASSVKISLAHHDLPNAKLGITMNNSQVGFEILDPHVRVFGLTTIPFTVDPDVDKLGRFFTAAARYHAYLGRTRGNNLIETKVEVDLYQLRVSESEFDDAGYPTLYPVGTSLRQDNRIEFDVIPSAIYGIKITNNTPWDLYPNIFFFDNSNLSIEASYTQSAVGSPYTPLKNSGGTLTAGYGSGGLSPMSYSLMDGQDIDVGFLKIFLTTKPVDMSDIAQSSPFKFDSARTQYRITRPPPDTWGTVLVPVVQRRGRS